MGTRLVSSLMVLILVGSASAELAGLWKLNDGAGPTAADSSGKGNHGTLVGVPQWVAGLYGEALQFNGQNSYVEIPSAASLEITGQVTVASWVNWTDAGDTWLCMLANGVQNGPWENYGMFVNRTSRFAYFTLSLNDAHVNQQTPNNTIEPGRWQHLCGTWDGTTARIYIDGELRLEQARTGALTSPRRPLRLGHRDGSPHYLSGRLDDVAIFNHALTQAEIREAMRGISPAQLASGPRPANAAVDVPRDATLGWTPGKLAAAHDVYFGTTFVDVNTAGRTDNKGVLASQDQTAATFDPPGLLAYGQTYYWRIDEVNQAPDNEIFKGDVWSFTAEPYAYPITKVTATASSAQASMGPENTINGSGLTGDLHGTEGTTMWLSTGAQPAWIQYQFDRVYKLYDLKVWNSNQLVESFIGFSARRRSRSSTPPTARPGRRWHNVPEFARRPARRATPPTPPSASPASSAKYVKLTINSTWGGVSAGDRPGRSPVLLRPDPGLCSATGPRSYRVRPSRRLWAGDPAARLVRIRSSSAPTRTPWPMVWLPPGPSPTMLSIRGRSPSAQPTTGKSMKSTPSPTRATSGASLRWHSASSMTSRAMTMTRAASTIRGSTV